MEWLLRRRLVEVASNLFIVTVNPVLVDQDDDFQNKHQPLPKADPANLAIPKQGLEAIKVTRGKHTGPLVHRRRDSGVLFWTAHWSRRARGRSPDYRGNGGTSRMEAPAYFLANEIVTWAAAKVFRDCPTTYKYSSTISWEDQQSPTMKASWERVGSEQRAEAYKAMTGTN
eukprot:scaffold17828_cov168-Amphora_coffeaeformis.AAC.7